MLQSRCCSLWIAVPLLQSLCCSMCVRSDNGGDPWSAASLNRGSCCASFAVRVSLLCVCVCVRARAHVCVCARACVCVSMSVSVSVSASVCMCMCVFVYARVCVYVFSSTCPLSPPISFSFSPLKFFLSGCLPLFLPSSSFCSPHRRQRRQYTCIHMCACVCSRLGVCCVCLCA